MGQRMEEVIQRQEHGSGSGAFSKFSGKSISTLKQLYKAQSLDISIIELLCVFYDLTLAEFLGISAETVPEAFKIYSNREIEPLEKKVNRIDKNVNLILEKLKA